MTKEEIFNFEAKRLAEVIKKINAQIKSNEQKFSEQEHFIIGFKEGMRGTQFNRQSLMSFYATEISELKRIINNPYFGRFEFVSDSDKQKQTIYIGKKAIMDNSEAISYDWRSDICSMYYDYNIGPAEYETKGHKEKGQILSKRQIVIKNGKLERIEEQDTISDDLILLKYLSECSDARLKSIVATIQREQNKIIRSQMNSDYIIEGVAGSGKTTVALHRIAYLLYNEARNINESEFMIIGPNKYFLNYISTLLPDLDIRHVSNLTFEEIALNSIKTKVKVESKNMTLQNVLSNKTNKDIITYKSSVAYLKLIERFIELYILGNLSKDLVYQGLKLYSSDKMRHVCLNNNQRSNNSYADRVSNLIKLITKDIKDHAEDLSHEIWQQYREKFLSLPKDSPHRKEIIDTTDEIQKEIKKGCPSVIKEYFKFIKVNPLSIYQAFIENIDAFIDGEEIDIAALKNDTLSKIKKKQLDSEDLTALLLIQYMLGGINEYLEYKHLVIDEAQDLSMGEYYVLKKLFPKAKFDVYGDINQAIYDYRAIPSWESLNNQIFASNAKMLSLNRSYRTTRKISDASNLILEEIKAPSTECISRDGSEIMVNNNIDMDTLLPQIKDLLDKKYESIAIICKDDKETTAVYKLLSSLGLTVNLITDKDETYLSGVTILPSYLSKGLEFDAVILYNANKNNYDDNIIDQKLLYVAITRAMHEVYINYTGEISNSLKSLIKTDSHTKKLAI